MYRFLIALTALAAVSAVCPAQNKPPPDHGSSFFITPDVGAWTICAASFSGEQAAKCAHDLVGELRTQYRVQAFVFNRGDALRREQEKEVAERRRQKEEYLRRQGVDPTGMPLRISKARIEDQYAVLVGGYRDMESARKELERIKKLPAPKSVPADTILQTAAPENADKQPSEQRTQVNPFGNAFVARNPTVPVDREDMGKADPFLKQLNAGEKRSLLKCKQPVTLMVKEFHGAAVIQPQSASSGFMEKLFGGKGGEQLSAAADNANSLAEALEKCGFNEVYVLHTRMSSVVSVGGFSGPKDPRMEQVRQKLMKQFRVATTDSRVGPDFNLISAPVPMSVPRM